MVPVIYAASYLLLAWIIGTFDLDIDIDVTNTRFLAVWVLAGGLATWFFGKNINAPVDLGNGTVVKNRHHLFFLPVQYWPIVVAIIALLIGSSFQGRFDYARDFYGESRTEFFAQKEKLLDLLDKPQVADLYTFVFDVPGPNEGNPWRGGGTAIYKLAEVNEDRILLIAPLAPLGSLRLIQNREDIDLHFPESPSAPGAAAFWVNKSAILNTVAKNYHKRNVFPGGSIPAMDRGNTLLRLTDIDRF